MPAWTRTPPSAASPAATSYRVTFPHLLAFPLHMAIMSDAAFPYAAIGMVHVENAITAHRAIGVGEALDVTTSVATPRPHARGVLLDFTTTVSRWRRDRVGVDLDLPAPRAVRRRRRDAGPRRCRTRRPAASSGACPPTSGARTPPSRATRTRSISTR